MFQNLVFPEVAVLREYAERLLHRPILTHLHLALNYEHKFIEEITWLLNVCIWEEGPRMQIDNDRVDYFLF